MNEPSIIWESLLNAEGDSEFLDADFVPTRQSSHFLQQQSTNSQAIQSSALSDPIIIHTEKDPVGDNADSDLALAISIQQAEEERVLQEDALMNPSVHRSKVKSKAGKCEIL